MPYTAVTGMHDILPSEIPAWELIERTARTLFARFGFSEIRTPIVEKAELFVRSIGEATAIVEKEMYTFIDQGSEVLALRPEGTASVMRAYIQAKAYADQPLAKYFTIGPMFRRERPQKGRYRQFHQISVEAIGTESPLMDAELMAMLHLYFQELKIDGITLEINSVGCAESRPAYFKKLLAFLQKHEAKLCADCKRRMAKNPLRVFDCKNPECQQIYNEAPYMVDHLSEASAAHYAAVKDYLAQFKIPFVENKKIVRGLDYYIRTAFEFVTAELGAQNAVASGGRYDGLVKTLGGPDVPGVGFAIGMERVVLLLDSARAPQGPKPIFFAILGEKARARMLPIVQRLREEGIGAEWEYEDKSLKSQMRHADKLGAGHVVLVGDAELANGVAMVRNMQTKEQREEKLNNLVDYLQSWRGTK